jgi:hypothetical protein
MIAHRQEEENALKISKEKNNTEDKQRLQRVFRSAGLYSGAHKVREFLDKRQIANDGILESTPNFLNRIDPKDRKPFLNMLDKIHSGEISRHDTDISYTPAQGAFLRGLEAIQNKKGEIEVVKVDPLSLQFLAKEIGDNAERLQVKYYQDNSPYSSADGVNGTRGTNVVLQ